MQKTNDSEKKSKKKLIIIIAAIVLLLGAAAAIIFFLLGGGSPEERELMSKLEDEGTATIEINEDIDVTNILSVKGNKTLVGSGKITAIRNLQYLINVTEGATLVLDGPTLDCNSGTGIVSSLTTAEAPSSSDSLFGAENGIYVAAGATTTIKSGILENAQGHGVRVLGELTVEGGGIANVGTNWIMMDSGSKASVTGGKLLNAGEAGIIEGADATLDISGEPQFDTTGTNIVYASGKSTISGGSFTGNGDYTLFNEGTMDVKNVEFSGAATLGYIQNGEGGNITISSDKFIDSSADFIYNQGNMTIKDSSFGTSKNSAIETKGSKASLDIDNCTFENIGQHVFLNKNTRVVASNITVNTCGGNFVSNKSSDFTGTNLTVAKVGNSGFMNEAIKDGEICGNLKVDTFSLGDCGVYGFRSNGGNLSLANGSVGLCTSYGLYAKDGKIDATKVNFKGMSVTGRATAMIGYGKYNTAVATFTDCDITGGARGLTNHANTTLKNCKIHGNKSTGTVKVGGAVNNDGKLIVEGGSYYNNQAASSGGALYNNGTMTVNGGTFKNNKTATSGGGIATGANGTTTINNATVTSNRATNYGGGLYNAGSLTINKITVSDNFSNKGGGALENTNKLTIKGGTYKNNNTDGSGGGLYNGGKGVMRVNGGTITNNKSGKDKMAGGIYNLGTLYVKGSTKITNNTAGTYGGGIGNSKTSDGTKIGKAYISGGTISGNKTINKGGGGIYNTSTMTISGGTISQNIIPSGTSGVNVYTSGNLKISGGTMKDLTAKPYDLYMYKGETSFSGSPSVGSMYKAADAKVKVSGKVKGEPINFYMTSYIVGYQALTGSSANIKASVAKFKLPDAQTKLKKYIDNNGRIAQPGVDPSKIEAELIRDGKVFEKGLLASMLAEATNGDTVRLVADATITDYTPVTYFTKTESTVPVKTINLTDDGKARTITITPTESSGFYVASSAGGESSTYLARNVVFNVNGKGGITFKSGRDEATTAAFYVSTNATLNVTGKVTFDGFKNIETTASTSTDIHSTGKYAGAVYVSPSGHANFTGATFKNCFSATGGAAIYASGSISIKNSTFDGNQVPESNGGALYFGSQSNSTVEGCTFTNNKANNGAAVYVYNGKVNIKKSTFAGNAATTNGSDIGASTTSTTTVSDSTFTVADSKVSSINVNSNADKPATVSLTNITFNDADNGDKHIVIGADAVSSIGGKMKGNITLNSAVSLGSALDSASDVTFVPVTDICVPGTQLLTQGKASAENFKSATKLIKVKNTVPDSDDEYALDEDGYIALYLAPIATLYRDGELVGTYTLVDALENAQDGDKIVLSGDAKIPANAAMEAENITIDGKNYSIKLGKDASLRLSDSVLKDVDAGNVTAAGSICPLGKVTGTFSLDDETVVNISEPIDSESNIELIVSESSYYVGSEIVVNNNEEDVEASDFAAAIGCMTIKNSDELFIDPVTGKLKENEKPNAKILGDPDIEGRLTDLLQLAEDGDTIEILSDITTSDTIVIPTNVKIKGQGYTITFNAADTNIKVGEGVELTMLSNLNIKAGNGITNNVAAVLIDFEGAVVSDGGKISAKGYPINADGNGTYESGSIVLEDAVASIDGIQFADLKKAFEQADTLAIANVIPTIKVLKNITTTGGIVTTDTNKGDMVLDLNNHTITVTGDQFLKLKDGITFMDSSEDKGGKIVQSAEDFNANGFIYNNIGKNLIVKDITIESNTSKHTINASGFQKGNIIVESGTVKNTGSGNAIRTNNDADIITVNGGFISGPITPSKGSVELKGGYYTYDVSAYCASGYECVTSKEYTGYTYKVQLMSDIKYEAKIGTVGYASLNDAVTAAKDGDVITIVKENFNAASDISIKPTGAIKKITVDFDGIKLTGSADKTKKLIDTNNINVTFINGTLNKPNCNGVNQVINASTNATVTLGKNIVVDGCTTNGTACVGTSASSGLMIIDGATVLSNNTDKNGRGLYVANSGSMKIVSGTIDCVVYNYNGSLDITGGLFSSKTSINAASGVKAKTIIGGGFFAVELGNNTTIAEGVKWLNTITDDGVDISKYPYKVGVFKLPEGAGVSEGTMPEGVPIEPDVFTTK